VAGCGEIVEKRGADVVDAGHGNSAAAASWGGPFFAGI
jgi:hypothetical protein